MPKNIAITIGINYQNIDNKDFGLPPLNYPHQDAQRLHDFLKHEEKFDKVWLWSDLPDYESPSRNRLIHFFEKKIYTKMNPEDNLWFFFSGHGKHKNNTTYLMLVDSYAGNVERTGFEINELTEDLKRSGAGNIILIIDACRNSGTKSLETENPKGIITIYSCAPGEESYEIPNTGGVFTHVLLEGLRQNDVVNCATVERLEQYLLTKVPEVKPGQHPCIHVDPPTKKNFILLPRQATLQADIKRLKDEAKDAELEENYDFALELWQRINIAAHGKDDDCIKAILRIGRKKDSSSASVSLRLEIELKSAKGVNYTTLRDLLAAGKWKEADQETARVMLEAANRTEQIYLGYEDIENFPCEDLRTIDQLWVKYSKGRFGFSVQKKIWLECSGIVDLETECKLADRVQWRKEGSWQYSDDLTFDLTAPPGHLPQMMLWVGGGFSSLAQRLVTCKIP